MARAEPAAVSREQIRQGVRRIVVKALVFFVVIGAILMAAAGSLKWIWGWTFLLLVGTLQTGTVLSLAKHDPDLLRERSELRSGTKNWDKFLAASIALFGPIAMFVIAGLDFRWQWSPELPLWSHIVAAVAALAGGLMVFWAMHTNHFFASTVRIQSDRGHRVCDSGPYQYVRHPGYSGMIVFNLAAPFVFGSLYALGVGAAITLLFFVRTVLEDRTLAAELPGYAEYRTRVRSRLIPLVW